MSGIFGYSREAVRVKVKVRYLLFDSVRNVTRYEPFQKCEGLMQPEFRKFSVDPQITSFEVLQSILAKAFDIKGEFTICYRTFDVYGQETYLPLLSDWDLDAAFLKYSKIAVRFSIVTLPFFDRAHNTSVVTGAEPCLCLRVDMKPFEESSDDWDIPSTVSVITQFRTGTAQEAKATPRLPGLIMNQVIFFNRSKRFLKSFDKLLEIVFTRFRIVPKAFRLFLKFFNCPKSFQMN